MQKRKTWILAALICCLSLSYMTFNNTINNQYEISVCDSDEEEPVPIIY